MLLERASTCESLDLSLMVSPSTDHVKKKLEFYEALNQKKTTINTNWKDLLKL